MASGVAAHADCISAFQDLKSKKAHKYIIFKLNSDNTEIIVEKTSKSSEYDEFRDNFKETECRWAVYDLDFDSADGKRSKICFISWSPDEAKIKPKMLYASSKDALRKALVGIAVDIQANDFESVTYDSVLSKASRTR